MAITKADWADDYAAWPRSTNPAVPAGRSIDDREKEYSVRGGASPERTIPHTTDNITYKEVITNEN